MTKRKKYMVTAENSEAFACSLVSDPAVEELFVAFSAEKELIEKLSDSKKHLITGVVAIPNKPIYRNNNGEEYDIVFSADAIESMAKKFMKNFRQMNVTLQHQEDATGIYMVEQWIKRDSERDKSVALGFSSDIPNGTWFQTYYVDSNEVWDRIIKGELRGFSLECVLGVEEFEKQIFEEQTPTETVTETPTEPVVEVKESVLDKILNFISPKPKEEVVEEQPIVEQPTVVEEAPVVEEQPKVEEAPVVEEKPIEEVKPNPLEEVVKNLQAEIETLKASNTSLLDKIRELGTTPSTNPVTTTPTGEAAGEDAYSNWRSQMAKYM